MYSCESMITSVFARIGRSKQRFSEDPRWCGVSPTRPGASSRCALTLRPTYQRSPDIPCYRHTRYRSFTTPYLLYQPISDSEARHILVLNLGPNKRVHCGNGPRWDVAVRSSWERGRPNLTPARYLVWAVSSPFRGSF